jgi:hypothetical protein
MKAFINRNLFTQTSLDSGSLTMLGAVIHSFPEPGEYHGTVLRGGNEVGNFHLAVDKDCPEMQVNIDLAAIDQPDLDHCEGELKKRLVVNPKGYAVFHVSHGAGGYAVRVGRLDGKSKGEPFDSRELKEGDMFAATLIRPGIYSVVNANTKVRGKIVVAYSKIKKMPSYRPSDPVSIRCTKKALELDKIEIEHTKKVLEPGKIGIERTKKVLEPGKIEIEPTQGQVYHFETPSRIRIELQKPDDGFEHEHIRPPVIDRWRKPMTR